MKNPRRNVHNILVTGGAGFIGSAFIRYLLSEQTDFRGTCVNLDALTYAGNLANLSSIQDDHRYRFIHGNICDQSSVEQLCQTYQIDTVINFAAESHVDRSIDNPQTFAQTNILGTLHLLEAVRKYPHIHFHHVSTDEVYGQLPAEGYFTENSPYQPNSPYSASKAASDHLVRAYGHTYQISTCISNCSNNYGPYQFPEKFIPVMILNCLDAKPLPIYGAGVNVRDWLFVDDHVEALYLLLGYGKNGQTYNIGGDCEWKNIELVKEIIQSVAALIGANVEDFEKLITFVKDRPGHDLRYAIDFTKITRELGWTPSHPFKEGLKKTITWYLENDEWTHRHKAGDLLNRLVHF